MTHLVISSGSPRKLNRTTARFDSGAVGASASSSVGTDGVCFRAEAKFASTAELGRKAVHCVGRLNVNLHHMVG